MGYSSKRGRPIEYASKSAHSHVINDAQVKEFLKGCNLPKESGEIVFDVERYSVDYKLNNPIKTIIAIDGGITEVAVKKSFPSSTITFFQFGLLKFLTKDLDELEQVKFIAPEQIEKLKRLQRIKLVLPTKNVSLRGNQTLTSSVRETIYRYFIEDRGENDSFIKSLKWFVFEEYESSNKSYQVASCPICEEPRINIKTGDIDSQFKFKCPKCANMLYLTDVFRLHEAVDDNLGAGGIIGYLTSLLEQFVLIHAIRAVLRFKPDLLNSLMFIKDGPLAFFGQTANMHKPMRNLCNFLLSEHNLFLVGITKSGPFVEHADEIADKLEPGEYFIPNNAYIYTYIQPGDPVHAPPFARTSYYSCNIIFKSRDMGVYVITIPTEIDTVVVAPNKDNFKNIDLILQNIDKLKCDMYNSALLPIALVNKLVSLADHPSSALLEKFASDSIS